MNNKHKPKSELIGSDGNIFNLVGIASNTLKRNGLPEQADEMSQRVFASNSYNEALSIITEYVEPVDVNESLDEHDIYNDFDLEIK